MTEKCKVSKSSTTIDGKDWVHIPHAGEILAVEFMEPLDMTTDALATAIGVDATRLQKMIDGTTPVDGELDLRLGRYFRMTEGYFLRLQDSCDLRIAKRELNGELDRITPRAA